MYVVFVHVDSCEGLYFVLINLGAHSVQFPCLVSHCYKYPVINHLCLVHYGKFNKIGIVFSLCIVLSSLLFFIAH